MAMIYVPTASKEQLERYKKIDRAKQLSHMCSARIKAAAIDKNETMYHFHKYVQLRLEKYILKLRCL